jgi:hypothetical protein
MGVLSLQATYLLTSLLSSSLNFSRISVGVLGL